MRLAIVDELGGENSAVADLVAILEQFLVDDAEAVAAADVEGKIDVPAEDSGQIHDHVLGDVCVGRGFEQRVLDPTLAVNRESIELVIDDLAGKRLILGALYQQRARDVGNVFHLAQVPLVVQQQQNLLSGLDVAQLFGLLVEPRDFVRGPVGNARGLENRRQRIAGFDRHRFPGLFVAGRGGLRDILFERYNRLRQRQRIV